MSINRSCLYGFVGKDPEVKHLENDSVVSNFTLATTEKGYTNKKGVEVPDRTEWHQIVCWGGLAKLAEGYIKKGMKLYVEGKIRTRYWDDQNGVKKYTTEIFAENIELPQKIGGTQQGAPPVGVADAPQEQTKDDEAPF